MNKTISSVFHIKQTLALILFTFTIFFFFSCNNGFQNNKGKISITFPEISQTVMSRAASNQPAEFTLTVTSEDISYSQQYTVTAGNTLTIDDLEPATYTLTCIAIINNYTYSGSQTAVVVSGETTQAVLQLTKDSGQEETPEEPEIQTNVSDHLKIENTKQGLLITITASADETFLESNSADSASSILVYDPDAYILFELNQDAKDEIKEKGSYSFIWPFKKVSETCKFGINITFADVHINENVTLTTLESIPAQYTLDFSSLKIDDLFTYTDDDRGINSIRNIKLNFTKENKNSIFSDIPLKQLTINSTLNASQGSKEVLISQGNKIVVPESSDENTSTETSAIFSSEGLDLCADEELNYFLNSSEEKTYIINNLRLLFTLNDSSELKGNFMTKSLGTRFEYKKMKHPRTRIENDENGILFSVLRYPTDTDEIIESIYLKNTDTGICYYPSTSAIENCKKSHDSIILQDCLVNNSETYNYELYAGTTKLEDISVTYSGSQTASITSALLSYNSSTLTLSQNISDFVFEYPGYLTTLLNLLQQFPEDSIQYTTKSTNVSSEQITFYITLYDTNDDSFAKFSIPMNEMETPSLSSLTMYFTAANNDKYHILEGLVSTEIDTSSINTIDTASSSTFDEAIAFTALYKNFAKYGFQMEFSVLLNDITTNYRFPIITSSDIIPLALTIDSNITGTWIGDDSTTLQFDESGLVYMRDDTTSQQYGIWRASDANSETPYIFVNLVSDNKTISLMNYTIDADGTITITCDRATYTKQ